MKFKTGIFFLSLFFFVSFSLPLWGAEKASDSQGERKEKTSLEKEEEVEEVEPVHRGKDPVEVFYDHLGFRLFPSSRTFVWRNILSAGVEYDNNVFLLSDNSVDDGQFLLDFESHLIRKWKRLLMELSGGFRYLDYFDENRLDEVFPRSTARVEYGKKENFFLLMEHKFRRNSVVNSLELQDNSPWLTNQFKILATKKHKRFLFELRNFATLVEYEELRGDYSHFGQGYLAGYMINEKTYFTFEYRWDYIDYQQPVMVNSNLQDHSLSHNLLAGVKVDLSRRLKGQAQAGIQFREDQVFFIFTSSITWRLLPRLHCRFFGQQSTEPSFFADYNLYGLVGAEARYLLTSSTALKGLFQFEWSRSQGSQAVGEEDQISYSHRLSLTQRLLRGIDLEIYYHYNQVNTDFNARDYIRHQVGIFGKVIF